MPVSILALLLVLALSALGGWWLSAGKTAEKPVRVMMFVGYFWLLAFVQVLLLAAVYFVKQHFFTGL